MEGKTVDDQTGQRDVPQLEIVGAHSAQTLGKVALRFIAAPRWGYARWEHTELLPGRLPPGSPPIPLPEGATLFGSCVRESGMVTDIYIDAGLPPADIYKLYHDRLLAVGWQHDADQQGALARSTWTAFRDEDFSCQVLFAALEFPWADRQYRVSLTVAVVEAGAEPHWMLQPAQRASLCPSTSLPVSATTDRRTRTSRSAPSSVPT